MGNKVFVSYCRKDTEKLEQFQPFATPLEREGLVDIWHDNRIEPGQDWAEEINKALSEATAAVLFISQDFLASEFIYQKELPIILAEAQAGRLTVLPVFLSPSGVEDTMIPFTDPETGAQREESLCKYQGLNMPDQPLSELSWSDQQRVYVKLAERIRELTGQAQTQPAAVSFYSSSQNLQLSQAKAYALTVEFKRSGDDLVTEYSRPGETMFLHQTHAWPQIENEIQSISKLIRGDSAMVQGLVTTAVGHWGEVLFKILFGSDAADHEILFRTAFHRPVPEPQPTPVAAPLRLRIVSADQQLLGLPWLLTTWKGGFLVDRNWLFMTGSEADPESGIKTSQPLGVLLASPGDNDHLATVQALFKELWPKVELKNYVRVVGTRRELENALAGFSPQIVYYFGERRVQHSTECLFLGDETGVELLPLRDFAKLLLRNGTSPKVIYLNAAAPETESDTLYVPFAQSLPLLIWRQAGFSNDAAKSVAVTWFRRWLQRDDDPVEALQHVLVEHHKNNAEMASWCSIGNYRDWQTDKSVGSLDERFSHLLIDREKQKSMTAKWLAEFVSSDSLRVMVLVPYAGAWKSPGFVARAIARPLRVSIG